MFAQSKTSQAMNSIRSFFFGQQFQLSSPTLAVKRIFDEQCLTSKIQHQRGIGESFGFVAFSFFAPTTEIAKKIAIRLFDSLTEAAPVRYGRPIGDDEIMNIQFDGEIFTVAHDTSGNARRFWIIRYDLFAPC